MKPFLLFPFILLAFAATAQSAGSPLLTDGALTGWHVIVQDSGEVAVAEQRIFAWEDSLLHVFPTARDSSAQPFAALVTDSSFADYRLHLEYRWGSKKFAPRTASVRDAGVILHVHDTTVFWPRGLECQIQEGDTGDAWIIGSGATIPVDADTGGFSPSGQPQTRGGAGGRYNSKVARSSSWEQPGWNALDLVVRGAEMEFYVNGHLVNALSKGQQPGPEAGEWVPLRAGRIALQAEGAELYYRNILLADLE